MTRFLRAITAALVATAATACGNSNTANPGSAAGACDLASHNWKQTSPGVCAESSWTFVLAGNGVWNATETGCASATGTAKYDGAKVTLDFQYDGGNSAGRYEWPLDAQCRGTTGKVSWTKGPLTGQSAPSTLSIVP